MATQAQRGRPAAGLTLTTAAKVNLYLRIIGRRADGFHDLESVMLPLAFGDELVFEPRDTGLTLECDHPELPTDESNLAMRAARLMAKTFHVGQGARILLRKRIPLAAGLGGGSGDAAAVLLGLDQLWRLGLTVEQLDPLAAQLGSDVNFLLRRGAALCRGRGELVTPLPCRLSATVLLINPGFGISTKWAYEHWAAAAQLTTPPPDVSLVSRALAADDLDRLGVALYNSLEAPSVRKFPVLELLKRELRDAGAAGALMSGSGATVFGLFRDPAAATAAAATVQRKFGPSMWTQVTKAAE